jgi:hypothetical protein
MTLVRTFIDNNEMAREVTHAVKPSSYHYSLDNKKKSRSSKFKGEKLNKNTR